MREASETACYGYKARKTRSAAAVFAGLISNNKQGERKTLSFYFSVTDGY
jgi:hypothetical protein